ncbi:hypothetical protein Q3G72_002539 [Acer saccharum]|nr:hypothetical protein Q3G72_002539 [Acer saccharum]
MTLVDSIISLRFSGSEAKELGLVSRVFVSKEELEEGVRVVAEAVQSNRNAKTIVFYYHYHTSTTVVDHLYRGLLLPSTPSQWRERAEITIVKGVGELVWAWGSELCPFHLASEGCLLTTLSRHIEGLTEGRYFWTMMHGNVVPETSIVKSPSAEVISVLKLFAVILRTQFLLLAEEEDIL